MFDVLDFAAMGDGQIEILLRVIDQAFDRKSWHGTNLAGSIRGLDVETASWRPMQHEEKDSSEP